MSFSLIESLIQSAKANSMRLSGTNSHNAAQQIIKASNIANQTEEQLAQIIGMNCEFPQQSFFFIKREDFMQQSLRHKGILKNTAKLIYTMPMPKNHNPSESIIALSEGDINITMQIRPNQTHAILHGISNETTKSKQGLKYFKHIIENNIENGPIQTIKALLLLSLGNVDRRSMLTLSQRGFTLDKKGVADPIEVVRQGTYQHIKEVTQKLGTRDALEYFRAEPYLLKAFDNGKILGSQQFGQKCSVDINTSTLSQLQKILE